MKYEQQFKAKTIQSWQHYYMAYSQLKQLLKQKSDHWLIEDEEEFENILGSELSKVCQFIHHQLERISERTQQLERQRISSATTTQNSNNNNNNNNSNSDILIVDDGYAAQVTDLVFELHDTAQFIHANKTAFDKMVKKHDRYTGFTFQHRYNQLMTNSSLDIYTQQLDSLMIRLCSLYDLCRYPRQQQQQQPQQPDETTPTQNDQSQQHEQPQPQPHNLHCTTFWIHPDNINEVKAICLFHLSIYPYGTKQSTTTTTMNYSPNDHSDNSITSVYLDNSNFDLYKKHVDVCNNHNTALLKKDAATTHDGDWNGMVRYQWYGHDASTIHLERQQGISNHQRCTVDGMTESAYFSHGTGSLNSGKKTITDMSWRRRHLDNTYHQIQQCIRQQHLEPLCRTACQRMTFQQQKETTTLRLHIDTNIKISKIVSAKSNSKHRKHQGSTSGGIGGETKVHAFPYGVLTLDHYHPPDRTAPPTSSSTFIPSWLAQLLSSHLVYPVPRFSMFVHAISHLYGCHQPPSFVSPWWNLSVPKDIRKPPCNNTSIGLSRTVSSAHPLINGHRQSSFEQQLAASSSQQHIVIPLTHSTAFSDNDDNDNDFHHANKEEHLNQHDDSTAATTYIWWWQRLRRRSRRQLLYDHHPQIDSHNVSLLTENDGDPTTITTPSSGSTTTTAKGKKKSMATSWSIIKAKNEKILNDSRMRNNRLTEPKTYFANERTFITWLQFCAVLLTVALSLFNHGDWISRWMGAMFLGMTCLLTFYALGRFQYRSWQLRTRRYVLRYDDVFGPTVLCFFLVIAMMINIYLRLPLFEF